MPDNMRAFVMKQVGEVAVVDKPIPEPGPNEAVIRTTAALVCTSDVHTVKGAIPVEPNVTLGHEAVGRRPCARLRGGRIRRGPACRRWRRHTVLPVRLLPARLLVAVWRHARRLQVPP